MSPTVVRYKKYRLFFFSREEKRMHIHVSGPDGEAKFWVEPIVAMEHNYGFTAKQLKELQRFIEDRHHEIEKAWNKHFKG